MKKSPYVSAWGRGAVLAMVLMVGALGLCCLVDGDHDEGQGMSVGLCLTLVSASTSPALLAGLLPLGWAAGAGAPPAFSASITVLTPPPRSL